MKGIWEFLYYGVCCQIIFQGIVPIFVAIGYRINNLLSRLKASATRKKLSPKEIHEDKWNTMVLNHSYSISKLPGLSLRDFYSQVDCF